MWIIDLLLTMILTIMNINNLVYIYDIINFIQKYRKSEKTTVFLAGGIKWLEKTTETREG